MTTYPPPLCASGTRLLLPPCPNPPCVEDGPLALRLRLSIPAAHDDEAGLAIGLLDEFEAQATA
jgi:hypothetical protein